MTCRRRKKREPAGLRAEDGRLLLASRGLSTSILENHGDAKSTEEFTEKMTGTDVLVRTLLKSSCVQVGGSPDL